MFKYLYTDVSTGVDTAQRGETNRTASLPHPRKAPIPRVRKSSKIHPSSYRPYVLARERITSWSTPYSNSCFTELIKTFPKSVIDSWRFVMQSSVTEETLQNYGAGLLRFTQFCNRHNIPEQSRMPASETLLSIFVAVMGAGKRSASSMESWFSGPAFW